MAIVKQKAIRSPTWWVGVGVFALAAAAYVMAEDYGRGGMMPQLTAIAIMGLAAIHTVAGLVLGVIADDEDWHDESERRDYARRRIGYMVMAVAVGIGVWLVGFHVTLPLFLLLFVGRATGRWLLGAALGVVIWAFTYLVLAQTLHIIFPSTVLQRWMIANGWF
jgi:hypothetical protein